MSYTKNTWATGDVITAEKLNNIENGIENLNTDFIIDITFSNSQLNANKNFSDIVQANENGKSIVFNLIGIGKFYASSFQRGSEIGGFQTYFLGHIDPVNQEVSIGQVDVNSSNEWTMSTTKVAIKSS